MVAPNSEVTNADALRLARTICYTCKIIYSRWPSHFVPSYLLLKILKKYQGRLAKNWLTLRPMPNRLYDQLTDDGGDALYRSEHIVFLHPTIYKRFNKSSTGSDHVSVRLLTTTNERVSFFGDKKKQTTVMLIKSSDLCPLHCAYVKENCFENLGQKFKMQLTRPLVEITDSNWTPQIATKVCIFLINPAVALSKELIDSVLKAYFSVPQLLSRNFTYAVDLTLEMLGHHLYSQHFDAFVALRRIHFRCIHLETETSGLEPCAIFLLKHTELLQTSTINHRLPAVKLDSLHFVPQCPYGMTRHFQRISSSMAPFLSGESVATLSSRHIWPIFLVQGDRGAGKLALLRCVADALGAHFYSVIAADICSGVPNQMETRLRQTFTEVNKCEPVILCLREFNRFAIASTAGGGEISSELDGRLLMAFEAELNRMFMNRKQVVVVALTEDKEISSAVQRLFLDTIKIDAPSQQERLGILRWLACTKTNKSPHKWDQQLEATLKQTAERANGFLFDDLNMLFNSSVDSLHGGDFEKKLGEMQSSYASSLGAPQVPNVRWSDIGGLAALKDEIQMSVDISLRSGAFAVRRSGILLYGPPGTGKTLVAKAVATECGMCFLAVQGPELLNMYVGQSEKNVREVFARARSASPCVIFLDELDSLAPNRGVAGDSGGVMDRVVSQLLAEMDGIQIADSSTQKKDERIFILAATNRPDLIDPALLRPGRFDKLLYVGPCITASEKQAVFEAQLQKFTFDKQYQTIEKLTQSVCSILPKDQHLTGADCYAICSNAWMNALRRIVRKKSKDPASKADTGEVEVNLDDFKSALVGFHSSVNERDLQYFQQLQKTFS